MFTAARRVQTSAGSSLRSRRGNERHPSDKCRQIGGRLERFDGHCSKSSDRLCAPGVRASWASKVDATLRTKPRLLVYFQNVALNADPSSFSNRPNRSWSTTQLPDFGRGCAIHDEEIAHDPLDDVGACLVFLVSAVSHDLQRLTRQRPLERLRPPDARI